MFDRVQICPIRRVQIEHRAEIRIRIRNTMITGKL